MTLRVRIVATLILLTLMISISSQVVIYRILKDDHRVAAPAARDIEIGLEQDGALGEFAIAPPSPAGGGFQAKITPIVVFNLLAILLCSLIALRVVRQLLGPLTDLTQMSRGVTLGDFSVRVPALGKDEIGELSAQFNSMCDQLERNQSQLVQAEKLKAVGEMAAGIAHDFNNVLFAISARLELVRSDLMEGKLKGKRLLKSIDVMLQAARDGEETVHKIREFSRPKKDKALTTVDLNELAHQALEMSRGRRKQLTRAGVSLKVRELYNDISPIQANPVEVREAFTNLINNSIDAMPDGGTLILSTAIEGDLVRATVADTGVGMEEEIKGKALDPFFTTKGAQGSGLGLSMVYGIMKRMGGDVRIESVKNQGTAVSLYFPVKQGLTLPELPGAPEQRAVTRALPRRRALVVDDEAYVGEALVELLESLGQEAVFARSGKEALEILERESFDIVFSDLGMPEMTGWDLTRRINTARPGLAIVLVTGWGDYLDDEGLLSKSVTEVLSKPVSADKLRSVLDQVFHREADQASLEETAQPVA